MPAAKVWVMEYDEKCGRARAGAALGKRLLFGMWIDFIASSNGTTKWLVDCVCVCVCVCVCEVSGDQSNVNDLTRVSRTVGELDILVEDGGYSVFACLCVRVSVCWTGGLRG